MASDHIGPTPDATPARTLSPRFATLPAELNRRAIFLDRDGVLVKNIRRDDGTVGSPRSLADFHITGSILRILRVAADAGFALIVVTNQPDVSRGGLDGSILRSMHTRLLERIPSLDAIYTCTHDDNDKCACRKPRPGLITTAAKDLGLRISESWIIGDRTTDILAGANAHVNAICVPSQTGGMRAARICGATIPHLHAESLSDALALAIGQGPPPLI